MLYRYADVDEWDDDDSIAAFGLTAAHIGDVIRTLRYVL